MRSETTSDRAFGRTRPELASLADRFTPGRVSVIIPCFNAEAFVGDAIESALSQSWPDLEVIVVDDGSTDGSWNVIVGFGDHVETIQAAHGGASAARNDGLMIATGEFIQFLDADDFLLPDAVRARANRLSSNTDSDAVFGDIEFVEHRSRHTLQVTSHHAWSDKEPLAYVIRHNIHTECPLHRRRLVYRIGGFDEGLACSQELDLHLRLVLAGARLDYFAQTVAGARVHSGSSRIGNRRWWVDNPNIHLRIAGYHQKLIVDATNRPATSAVKEALAFKLWSRGMIAGRHGAFLIAHQYFKHARKLFPQLRPEGSLLFRSIHRVFGPNLAVRLVRLRHRRMAGRTPDKEQT